MYLEPRHDLCLGSQTGKKREVMQVKNGSWKLSPKEEKKPDLVGLRHLHEMWLERCFWCQTLFKLRSSTTHLGGGTDPPNDEWNIASITTLWMILVMGVCLCSDVITRVCSSRSRRFISKA